MPKTHSEKRLLGYARVSTYGQTLDAQLEQLRKAGCSSRNIYREKVTGARADRRELNRMLGKLAAGRAGREGFRVSDKHRPRLCNETSRPRDRRDHHDVRRRPRPQAPRASIICNATVNDLAKLLLEC